MQRLLASGSPSAPTYVDDVFSAYTYTGTGASNPIVNGVDLSGKGGLVWTKSRGAIGNNYLIDSVRGIGQSLSSDTTGAQGATTFISSLNSNGYTLSTASGANGSGATFVGWTFRKAAKFFDVVTYTGTGSAQTISHSLGQVPGMIIVKAYSGASAGTYDWAVYHTALGNTKGLYLDLTNAAATASSFWNNTSPTSTQFTVGNGVAVNDASHSYVAYIFAHDTSADGIIQCGSYTGNASTQSVTLGWEPQFLLIKQAGSAGNNWMLFDSARGLSLSSEAYVSPNLSNAEASLSGLIYPTATGFFINTAIGSLNDTGAYLYMAIRRPNKPPTTGTQVYNAIARTGTGAAATVTGVGFAPDLYLSKGRAVVDNPRIGDRLRGASQLLSTPQTAAETTSTSTQDLTAFLMDGVSLGTPSQSQFNTSAQTEIDYFFKRAPGVFDEVCYTGTGSATTVAHNLGVAPELIVIKHRVSATEWPVYHSAVGNTAALVLNTTAIPATASTYWNNTSPTSSVFTVGTATATNGNTGGLVAYLFATKAGISKVFSYTGNGSSQTINCGFSAGARFILIKRTDSTGDWYVWDTVRGVVAGNDPHLSLNTTAAEVTTNDSIDPDNSGFIVNQLAATNINVTSATYIGLALS